MATTRPRPSPKHGDDGDDGAPAPGTDSAGNGAARPKERETKPPVTRAPMPAGNAIKVIVIAFLVATVFNAQGMWKTAQGLDLGWKRDVAIDFMRPFHWAAGNVCVPFTGVCIQSAREALQDASGRSGDDDVNLFVARPTVTTTVTTAPPGATTAPGAGTTAPAGPTTAPGVTTAPPAAPAKLAFSPQHPLKIWIAGDSLSITPGESFLNKAPGTQVMDVKGLDGRVSTGLARPDVFNWFQHVKDQVASLDPDLVILTFGANDDQSLFGAGNPIGPLGSDPWKAEYASRVGGMMDTVINAGHKVIWVGIPIVENTGRNARYQMLNTIYAQEAAKRPGNAYFVDTYPLFQDAAGNYNKFLTVNGQQVEMRAADGIHFTRAGGDRIADAVIGQIGQIYDLTSWKNPTTTTTTIAPTTTTVATTTSAATSTTRKK
ncbi:MAG: putative periplasmic protein [Actinomycetia bacterium]|nr:putative periplasmic protein [Actinomycetes bacterium]